MEEGREAEVDEGCTRGPGGSEERGARGEGRSEVIQGCFGGFT
jgi:hypothetical protein